MATDGPDPPPCDPELFSTGTRIYSTHSHGSNAIERWVKEIAVVSGRPLHDALRHNSRRRQIEKGVMGQKEISLTTFLRNHKKFLSKLDATHDIVLQRRGKSALRISLASRFDEWQGVLTILAEVIQRCRVTCYRLLAVSICEEYPWTQFLSKAGKQEFVQDWLDAASEMGKCSGKDGEKLGISQIVAGWKALASGPPPTKMRDSNKAG